MKMIEKLKSRNRTLLEVRLGILFWTFIATAAGVAFPIDSWGLPRKEYFFGLWIAALLVSAAYIHMYRCLDRALDLDQKTAVKIIYRGYIIRYSCFAAFAAGTAIAGLLDPVVLCLGYLLLMKVAAYSQPFTHKLCNRVFHETDPVPEPLSDGEIKGVGPKI